jgi:4-carboxymuconolactone decarboxylase
MRFPNLEPERMSEAQRRVHDAIAGGPRGGVRGPFAVLLRSPELADRVQKLGEHRASTRRCRRGSTSWRS